MLCQKVVNFTIVSQINFAQGVASEAKLNCTNDHTDQRVAKGGVAIA